MVPCEDAFGSFSRKRVNLIINGLPMEELLRRDNLPEMASLQPAFDVVSVELYKLAGNQLSSTGGTDANYLVSPASIIYCVMLAYFGAVGPTKSNIATSLKLNQISNGSDATLLSAFSTALTALNSTRTPDYTLSLANGIFVEQTYPLVPAYVDTTVNSLGAGVFQEDFLNNPENGRLDVNNWVADKTNQKILDLIPPGAVNNLTKVILANAVYFKAAWAAPFVEQQTTLKPFHNSDGTTVPVNMMRSLFADGVPYFEDDSLGIQYLEMPYNGSQASMLIYLPKQTTGLAAFENSLSADVIQTLASHAVTQKVDVSLPRFRTDSTFDRLEKILQQLGITLAFDPANADFSGLSPKALDPRLYISRGIHKTFISVNENGTEAAAATALLFAAGSAFNPNPPPVPSFTADHPFMYAIRHNPTKLILFLGRIENFQAGSSDASTTPVSQTGVQSTGSPIDHGGSQPGTQVPSQPATQPSSQPMSLMSVYG